MLFFSYFYSIYFSIVQGIIEVCLHLQRQGA